MNTTRQFAAAVVLAIFACGPSGARAAEGHDVGRVAAWTAPPVDVDALLARDARNAGRKELPPKVGFPMKTAITTETAGTWSRGPDGDRIWRLRVVSEDALWIVLGFTRFAPQPGGRLYVSDASGRRVLGPYGAEDVRPHGQLWFPPLEGDNALVELHWPAERGEQVPAIVLGTVMHGYRPLGGKDAEAYEKGLVSGACNNDVACPEGVGWEDPVRSVVRLLDGSGSFCSGALVNNTAGDCTPYVLTAYHCHVDPPSTTYQFDYQRSQCGGGTVETTHTITGSTRVARNSISDFDLLLLDESPPLEWNVYYSGWSRATTPATRSAGIHHPSGDVKKISHNFDYIVPGQYWGDSHWRVTDWEDGTTEPRSSGSPLYDQDKRIVGQLHGGTASCTSLTWDEYGRFDRSWTGGGTLGTRLSDRLDPLGSAPTTLDGLDATTCGSPPVLELALVDVSDARGNADGVVDPGDTLELRPQLDNTGVGQTARGVRATVSALTPGVTATVPTVDWPDILGGEGQLPLAPQVVEVAASVLCGQRLDFELDVVADQGAWSETFSVATGVQTGAVDVVEDDVESGTAGWSTVDTEAAGNLWYRTSVRSNSPSTSWFVNDLGSSSDSSLIHDPLPALPPGSVLTFAHYMNSEAAFDGGVLELSTDGGTSWIDAGPWMLQGGYNLTVSAAWGSAIGGRAAWSGDLNGWQNVAVDLAPFAGEELTLRWRFVSDALDGDEGWFVDDVVIAGGTFECSPVAPGEAAEPGRTEPLRLDRDATGDLLSWGAPLAGGPPVDYVLYSMPLGDLDTTFASCAGALGDETGANVALPVDAAFLVVARNAEGEGSYGDSTVGARPPALATCP